MSTFDDTCYNKNELVRAKVTNYACLPSSCVLIEVHASNPSK